MNLETEMTTRLLESAPAEVEARLAAILPQGEDLLVLVSADIAPDGASYGERWVAMTPGWLVVMTADEEPLCVPVDEILRVHTEPLVGGGRLEVERRDAPTVSVPYTQSLSDKFSEVARGLEQLRVAQPFRIDPVLESMPVRAAIDCCLRRAVSVQPASRSGRR
jgi:hypothetical protein